MTIIESLKSGSNKFLVFQDNDNPEIKCDYLLIDENNKILAFGWQVENSIESDRYDFYNQMRLIRDKHAESNIEDFNASIIYFAINDSFIWFLEPRAIMPIGERRDNTNVFFKRLKDIFPHIKSEIEIKEDEIEILKAEIISLKESGEILKRENEQKTKNVKSLELENVDLNKQNLEYAESLDYYRRRNTKDQKVIGAIILEKLTPSQLSTIKASYGTDKQINYEYVYPSVVLKTFIKDVLLEIRQLKLNSSSYIETDGIPEGAYADPMVNISFTYLIIKPNGEQELVYDGKPEIVNLLKVDKQELNFYQKKHEVLGLEYYLIEL